ncbi:MAG: hypothetical protein A3K03_04680 [Bdellovibrionales bacterium RIFOXYD1_FULL_44_7]|nr:MAG: hypothetical protein A3K03_04680 [Bdellovibrionales bacterium RIFOXYD1_FULL_44_7]
MTSKVSSSIFSYNWYRGFIQGKTRIALAWFFAFVIGFSARSFPALPGVVLCFLGATVRFWASGYLRKDSRPAVGGPYAFVRNPLYLGTYLMALGIIWAIHQYILLAVISVLFAAVYHYIILDEEIKLQKLFGKYYESYCKLVPRFFPRVWPPLCPASKKSLVKVNPELDHHDYSWKLAVKNKAYEAYASFLGLVVFVTITAYFWKKFAN